MEWLVCLSRKAAAAAETEASKQLAKIFGQEGVVV
jgi:hypothetical protein